MAVSGKTARRLLKFLLTTDPPAIHEAAELLANQLDNDVELKTGKLSELPAASLFGKMFYVQGDATAANNGILWLDLGATWVALVAPAGQWVAPSSVGAKMQAHSIVNKLGARTEQGGTVCRLRGLIETLAGQELHVGEELLTLPAGVRPASTQEQIAVLDSSGQAYWLIIATTGVITLGGAIALKEAKQLSLIGVTFPLT